MSARGPYRAAVPALIGHGSPVFPPPLQAEAEDAVRAITRFDADIASVELAPLAAVLLRTESASSSQIEGVTAGARALALAAIEKRSGRNAELVVANVTAMQRGIELADDISVGSILAVHDALLHGHEYAAPGRFRTEQVWIGSTAISPHAASFVPPHHDRVPAAMDDLIDFVRRTDLPVLVHVAIAHAQFETIHPFNDGNGRVGRTLVHAMLRHADVTRHLTVPVSAGLLADTSAYFDALTAYRAGDVEPIVRQFIAASFRAVDNGRILIEDLDRILQSWTDKLPSRRGSAARRLLPLLVNQPAVNVAYAVETTGVALSAAQRAVEQLEEAGILVRAGAARRNRVWTAPDVIDALDRFAERAGRRS
ncbi:hypothetical protein ASE19_17570 [Nocardioides sp. Root79]|nr:hypothetical protein ASE19_17570 [Nocardioides sp. Root79]KRC75140.1 hypothetical protein ASE20_19470 [Nocardioides sp. Root240]